MITGRRSLILSLLLLIAACAGGGREAGLADRGIGGTGIAVSDRGIGGTGIVGTVTAFGSVWVNGLRVDLPAGAVVRIEGRAVDTAAVRIGHLVAMKAAAGGPTGLEARSLDVRYAVAGPVERLEGTTATVLGQRIDAADAEGRDALRPGAWVAVSGLRRADGAIDASRVDGWSDAHGWLLRGRLDAVSPTALTVAGLTLSRTVTDAAPPPAGSMVRVAGPGAVPTLALSVAPDPFNPFGDSVDALSVETFVDDDGRVADGDGDEVRAGASEGRRVVIDSGVGAGGGLRDSRSFRAPALGGTAAPGADPSARAAGLAREGMRRDGPPGNGVSGFGPPEGTNWGDMDRRDGPRGMGRGPDGPFGAPLGGGHGKPAGGGDRDGARGGPAGPGLSSGWGHGGGPRGGRGFGSRGGGPPGGRGGGAGGVR
ncbi:DUF5666 domain-containing protein [Azospirillum agricola]|uniref:DUF5666 domain-containing protein n=1 Tax=Azospirillum agricola TaxID=1720247 RepID=UPI000A0F3C49|nr:DUF5666 domain-containing protein [Azospirillum agricola]SMH52261.1 hypothetical protein SAMN02982994_3082 [Azospirillum lipoferum]